MSMYKYHDSLKLCKLYNIIITRKV
uniref:Uncharacterized protein n=1 Tax=Arundo donax TaxID=35708 RepID=A0A0A8YLW4_ARUDO